MAELPIATQCGTGAPAAPPLDSRFRGNDEMGIYSRTNDSHETGPPKSEQLPLKLALDGNTP